MTRRARRGPLPCCDGSVVYLDGSLVECVRCGAGMSFGDLVVWLPDSVLAGPVGAPGSSLWRIAARRPPRRDPASPWRVQDDDGNRYEGRRFDELAVGGWLHLERMGHRHWYLGIGTRKLSIRVPLDPTKEPEVMLYDGPTIEDGGR